MMHQCAGNPANIIRTRSHSFHYPVASDLLIILNHLNHIPHLMDPFHIETVQIDGFNRVGIKHVIGLYVNGNPVPAGCNYSKSLSHLHLL